MAHVLKQRCIDRMAFLHPDVRLCVMDAAADPLCPEFMVVEALRSRETCMVNYGKGRTAAQLRVHGIDAKYAQPKLGKVTWLSNPFNSKHCKQSDGFSHAVDLLPAPFDWKDPKQFDLVNAAIQRAAKKRGIRIKWGADWNQNGKPREKGETDSPHWELAR
jgi:peptidoglycan L-alanyl-D-glutamate endopeptidase CwlK